MCYQVKEFQEGAKHILQHWRTKMQLVEAAHTTPVGSVVLQNVVGTVQM